MSDNKGSVVQIIGPVVDVEFSGYMPDVNEALETQMVIPLN